MTQHERPEFAYIDWVRQHVPRTSHGVEVGIGDDTAVVRFSSDRSALVTTDMLLEGSCFRLHEAGARRVGRKAMRVNLSDIAAMAGVPRFAVVSLGLPRTGGRRIAEELFLGMSEVAEEFQTAIVGGDTNSWDGPLAISVTLLGEATERGAVRRSGAQVGDWIFVTGKLGGSILGKHLDFTPRVREALAIHRAIDLHAMIDISDGLAADLHHLCEESHCGAILRAAGIPISESAHELARQDGRSALDHAIRDGEDFELLFTTSPEDGKRLLTETSLLGVEVTHLGEVTATGVSLDRAGKIEDLPPLGYVHALGQ